MSGGFSGLDSVRDAVTVTYGDTGRMSATYRPDELEPAGRGRVNGYGRERATAAAEAAVAAVLDYAAKTGRAAPDWARVDAVAVGRIGRNRYAVVFLGVSA